MNVKPGDLAYLVRAHLQENIGRIVEVVSISTEPSPFTEVVWNIKNIGPMQFVNTWTNKPTKDGSKTAPDSWLRPISGVPVNDEVTDDVKEPA